MISTPWYFVGLAIVAAIVLPLAHWYDDRQTEPEPVVTTKVAVASPTWSPIQEAPIVELTGCRPAEADGGPWDGRGDPAGWRIVWRVTNHDVVPHAWQFHYGTARDGKIVDGWLPATEIVTVDPGTTEVADGQVSDAAHDAECMVVLQDAL